MEFHKITDSHRKYNVYRFWELFTANTITFSFWLASSSFAFFGFQSLSSIKWEGAMDLAKNILAWVFLGFGIFCVLVIVWLGFSWLSGWQIIRYKRIRRDKNERKQSSTKHPPV
jgi:hypothetical protein